MANLTQTQKLKIDAELEDWNNLPSSIKWHRILIGNGASMAISRDFGYGSLFERAKSLDDPSKNLTTEDLKLFKEQNDTTNFEQVLGSLASARNVSKILKLDHTKIDERYNSIRTALLEAVKEVHVDWQEVESSGALAKLGNYFDKMKQVFTTNYDLLLYWSLMHVNADFLDFFVNDGLTFDSANTENFTSGNKTEVFFLHGSVHLFQDVYGETKKVATSRSPTARNLLNILRQFEEEDQVPLFVAEGNHREKMATIRRNSYLSFCRQKFGENYRPLIVFGNQLSNEDLHLLSVLGQRKDRPLAFSVYPMMSDEEIVQFKTRIRSALGRNARGYERVFFFDSTTHPLGDSSLAI